MHILCAHIDVQVKLKGLIGRSQSSTELPPERKVDEDLDGHRPSVGENATSTMVSSVERLLSSSDSQALETVPTQTTGSPVSGREALDGQPQRTSVSIERVSISSVWGGRGVQTSSIQGMPQNQSYNNLLTMTDMAHDGHDGRSSHLLRTCSIVERSSRPRVTPAPLPDSSASPSAVLHPDLIKAFGSLIPPSSGKGGSFSLTESHTDRILSRPDLIVQTGSHRPDSASLSDPPFDVAGSPPVAVTALAPSSRRAPAVALGAPALMIPGSRKLIQLQRVNSVRGGQSVKSEHRALLNLVSEPSDAVSVSSMS